MADSFLIGTRGSALALTQAQGVQAALAAAWPQARFGLVIIKTSGDKWSANPTVQPLPAEFGKGLFTKELEEALRRREVDLAVHSLKDLPVELPADLALGAVPQRADWRDVLITKHPIASFDELPPGALLAVGSPRRRLQLLKCRPDLKFADIRGNIDTRLRKLRHAPDWHGIVLAQAGLERLGPELGELRATLLSEALMLPAPGQGALGLQIRADDARARETLAPLQHAPTAAAVRAERAFLQALGGGCAWPVGALGTAETKESLQLRGIYFPNNSSASIAGAVAGPVGEPEALGKKLAHTLLHSC